MMEKSETMFVVELFFVGGGQHGPYMFAEDEYARLRNHFLTYKNGGSKYSGADAYDCFFGKKKYELTLDMEHIIKISGSKA